jgi:hypothetical protein
MTFFSVVISTYTTRREKICISWKICIGFLPRPLARAQLAKICVWVLPPPSSPRTATTEQIQKMKSTDSVCLLSTCNVQCAMLVIDDLQGKIHVRTLLLNESDLISLIFISVNLNVNSLFIYNIGNE